MTFYVRNKNEQFSSREFIVLKGTQNCHVLSSLLIRPSLSVAHFLIPVFLPALPSRPFFANNFIPRRHATPRHSARDWVFVDEYVVVSGGNSAERGTRPAPCGPRRHGHTHPRARIGKNDSGLKKVLSFFYFFPRTLLDVWQRVFSHRHTHTHRGRDRERRGRLKRHPWA